MKSQRGFCKVEVCGAEVEGDDVEELQNWLAWHVYQDHRDIWAIVIGADRLPNHPIPDLSLIFIPQRLHAGS